MSIEDLSLTHITTVQLPASRAAQRQFLAGLSTNPVLGGSLSALQPGPAADVFVIPHGVEQAIRAGLGLNAQGWEAWLRQHGALTVNALQRDAYVALMTRGATLQAGAVLGAAKVTLPNGQPQHQDAAAAAVLPKDFVGPHDWHLDERGVNAVRAWALFAAEPRFDNQLPWADIRIGHIDTGYTEHVALGWNAGTSVTVRHTEGRDFWDGAHDQDGPRDPFLPGFPGHGTRISAAMSGFWPAAPGGPFYGVAPGAQVLPLRVTDSVIVDHVQHHVRDAIRHAVDHGCQVINISLGALRRSSSLAAALDHAWMKGCIVVCAAGQVWGEVIYPGRFNRCVTMGGVGPGLTPWRSGAKGPYVDLCGPADSIRRVLAESLPPKQAANQMAQETGDGTSYATAACSAAAALWLSWHGVQDLRARYAPHGLWQIPKIFKALAMQTARPGKWPASEAGQYGTGVLDIEALLKAPLPASGTVRQENEANGQFDNGSMT